MRKYIVLLEQRALRLDRGAASERILGLAGRVVWGIPEGVVEVKRGEPESLVLLNCTPILYGRYSSRTVSFTFASMYPKIK